MARAIQLAKAGIAKTKPNPTVGCVITKNNKLIAEGFHQKAGSPHAEIEAINQVKNKPILKGATIYITLEPCSFTGKTPPCLEAIISYQFSRVVIAMQDPNPNVNGTAIKLLKKKGIQVEVGLMQEQAQNLNLGFVSRMTRLRPYVISKVATSIDGKIALQNGKSKWISNIFSRQDVQYLRQKVCGILTSVQTINYDNPLLNYRLDNMHEQPYRFILDPNLSINPKAKILNQDKVVIFFDKKISINNLEKFKQKKPIFVPYACSKSQFNLKSLFKKIAKDYEINNLLIEAGSGLNGSLLKAKLIDELIVYQCNMLLGGLAKEVFANPLITDMSKRINLTKVDERYFADDKRLTFKTGYVD
jgi:diaminohydroxyphosphoribosylaminopyrimidine deaminase/5-amino-6-(5-phosphoribosylamino)uracil reductase